MTYIRDGAGGSLHHDAVDGLTTNPHSQDSSGTEANASQRSQLCPSTSGFLEPLQPGLRREAVTPSTSLSDYSSEDNVVNGQRIVYGAPVTRQDREIAHVSPVYSLDAMTDISDTAHKGGLKRTATGQIKSPLQGSSQSSPVDTTLPGHSRNTSIASRSSHIGELSDKLQARLSYAKVKVQYGWENHSISQLEHITSHQDAPVGVASRTTKEYSTSPASYSPVDRYVNGRGPRRASTSTPPEYNYPPLLSQGVARSIENPSQRFTTSGTTMLPVTRPNETYEQFWHTHSNNMNSQARGTNFSSANVPSLAPPVELSSRTATATRPKPPLLHTSQYFPGHLPSTPPQRGSTLAKMRTPSQQAAVEQDALEGLLSMNSPANSQSHPPVDPAPLRSPLQGQVFRPLIERHKIIKSSPIPTLDPTQTFRTRRELNDEEINRMLDEMSDSSSSDDDDVVERRLAPREIES